jgi:hypothetical protein
MSPRRFGVSLLLGLATLAHVAGARAEGPPPAPRPAGTAGTQPPKKPSGSKEALALHDEAWTLYEEGRYRAAIERLEAAR